MVFVSQMAPSLHLVAVPISLSTPPIPPSQLRNLSIISSICTEGACKAEVFRSKLATLARCSSGAGELEMKCLEIYGMEDQQHT